MSIITYDKTLCVLCGESIDKELVYLSEFYQHHIDWRREDRGWKRKQDQFFVILCFHCHPHLFNRLDPFVEPKTFNFHDKYYERLASHHRPRTYYLHHFD